MSAIISVLNGGSVAKTLALQEEGAVVLPRTRAVPGDRYLLEGADGNGVPEDIVVKRSQMHLLLAKTSGGFEQELLIIEDFFANNARLFGLGADGKHQPYALIGGEARAAPAADAGGGLVLKMTVTPAGAEMVDPLIVADESMLPPAGGLERATARAGVAGGQTAGTEETVFAAAAAAAEVRAIGHLPDMDPVQNPMGKNGDMPMDGVMVDDRHKQASPASISSDIAPMQELPSVFASATTPEAAIDAVLDDTGAIQGNILNGGYTDDGSPRIVGKAESGVLVYIYDGVELLGEVVAGAEGAWFFVPRLPLGDGRHVITVMYEYLDGDVSDVSAPYVIHVDTSAPDVPVIVGMMDDEGRIQGQIGNGGITDDSRPVIDGVAEPNATVIIYDKGVEVARTPVAADGNWTYSPDAGFEDGLHILEYVVIDRAGNASEKSAPTEFLIDTRPELVEIYAAEDDAGMEKGTFVSGSVTDDTQPRLFGTATAGGTVKIYEGTALLGEATAGVDGKWEFTPSVALTEGHHSLAATVITPAKGESERSATFDFVIDITVPDRPTIEQVHDDRGAVQGALNQGQSTDDTTPTLSGKAEAGSTVRVYDGGILLGNTVADSAGKWSYTPSRALLDGEHVFTITAQDKAGSTSEESNSFSISIDTIPPATPVIELVYDDQGSRTGYLSSGDWTDDSKPTISGSADPFAKVVIRDHGLEIGYAIADGEGKWSFEPFLPMGLGPHKLTAEATDAAGNTSDRTNSFDLTLGSADRPAAPAITSVVDDVGAVTGHLQRNDVTDDARPTINGTAQAGTTVSVYIDGVLAGSTLVAANGEWSFTPAADLVDGLRNITAEASSAVGNVSDMTGLYPIIVDTTPPVQPGAADAALWDDVGQIVGQISNGTVTDDNTPTFVGKAEPNATVAIYDGDELIGRVATNESGDWSFTPSPALADGQHSLSYEVMDKAGNVGPKSPAIGFEVNTDVEMVSIDGAIDDTGSIQGEIPMGGVTDDTMPSVHGIATAGGTVKVYEGTTLLGQALAGSDGKWSFTPGVGLNEGPHSLTATVTTAANGESARSDVFDFTIDVTSPSTPTIELIRDDAGAVQGALQQGQSTDDTTPTLSGKAEADSIVSIYDKGVLLGSVTAGDNGDWSYTPNPALLDGPHKFTVKAEDKAGNASPPSEVFDIVVDTVAPDKPVIDQVYDDQGARTGSIAAGGITDDARPTITGTAEAGCTVIVRNGELELGAAVVDADGRWTLELPTDLADGGHVLSVAALDVAGNLSAPSDSFELIVDTSIPTVPKITNVRDDVGVYTGILQNGGSTDDARPTINGNGKAGELIEIRSGDTLLGSTVVGENGRWSFTPEIALTEGVHGFSAVAVSAGGAESEVSNIYAVRVDTVAPDHPIIDAVQDNAGAWMGDLENGQTTDDRTPTFVGRAEPNSTIIVFKGGEEIGFAAVNESGSWTYAADRLAYGEHRFTFQSFDVAGNMSDASEEWVVVVAMAIRSAPEDAHADTSSLPQELLVDAQFELFNQEAVQREAVSDPVPLIGLYVSTEGDRQESWVTGSSSACESNERHSAGDIELTNLFEEQLVA